MATVEQIMDALGEQIEDELSAVIENLQVVAKLNANPTLPASIDIYPGDPFMERGTMGHWDFYFTVRARVSTADNMGGQSLLLSMMDPDAAESLTAAVESDKTLGGVVGNATVEEGPSAYGIFNDPGDVSNRLLGALWRVRVIP